MRHSHQHDNHYESFVQHDNDRMPLPVHYEHHTKPIRHQFHHKHIDKH